MDVPCAENWKLAHFCFPITEQSENVHNLAVADFLVSAFDANRPRFNEVGLS